LLDRRHAVAWDAAAWSDLGVRQFCQIRPFYFLGAAHVSRDSAGFRNLLLRIARHPHVEDAAVARLLSLFRQRRDLRRAAGAVTVYARSLTALCTPLYRGCGPLRRPSARKLLLTQLAAAMADFSASLNQ